MASYSCQSSAVHACCMHHCQQHQRRHAVRCMHMEAYGPHRCALESLLKGCVPVLQRPAEFVPS